MGQLFNPPPFRVVQPLFQPIHYSFIDGFRLPITLWVSWCGVSVGNSQLTAISSESFTVRLEAVVRDQGMRDSESSDDIFPNKFLGINVSNVCQWLSFDLFCEIIRADKKKPFVPHCFKKWS